MLYVYLDTKVCWWTVHEEKQLQPKLSSAYALPGSDTSLHLWLWATSFQISCAKVEGKWSYALCNNMLIISQRETRGKALGITPWKCNVYSGAKYALFNTTCEEGTHHFSFLPYLFPLPSGGCHRLGPTVSPVLFSLLSQHPFLKRSSAWLASCKCTRLSAFGCRRNTTSGFQSRDNPARWCL